MRRPAIAAILVYLLLLQNSATAKPNLEHYAGVDETSSQAMRDSLHAIIDDHTRIPYTSSATDTWDVLEIADEHQNDSNRIITIYRNVTFMKVTGGNDAYNREHTWPNSYGFPDEFAGNYPYSDMHHLFLSDIGYNASRENKPFDNCDANCDELVTEINNDRGGAGGAYPGDSSWTDGAHTAGRWETWAGRRGDVARALMYMDVRYEGGTHGISGFSEPDLILTNDRNLIDQSRTGDNESIGYMGLLAVLLQWNKEDPVDQIERQHHEAVASFQGNRNPFIDHPEWADCVFEEVCNNSISNVIFSSSFEDP